MDHTFDSILDVADRLGDALERIRPIDNVEQHIAKRDAEPSEFEFGLDLILDGLERQLATTRAGAA